jgi:hypothetical protein
MVSFTTATRGARASSRSLNGRPRCAGRFEEPWPDLAERDGHRTLLRARNAAIDGNVLKPHPVVEGHVAGDAGGLHARQRFGARQEILEKPQTTVVAVLLEPQIDGHHDQALRREAQGERLHLPQAVQKETGARQHHQRHRHLSDDQQVAEPVPRRRRAAPAVFQGLDQIEA